MFLSFKFWRVERRWKKHGRQEMFTWIYRYLRLHRESLKQDPVYQEMIEYHRATLVAYERRKQKRTQLTDRDLGVFIDLMADKFNLDNSAMVNAYKPCVDEIYKMWEIGKSGNEVRI